MGHSHAVLRIVHERVLAHGGQGGFGGKGGGGRGGHAIGIAYTGAMPTIAGASFTKGTAGQGGKGADAAHDGDPGVQADTQVFP